MLDLPWGQLIINGLALGSLYALTAFGIVLIYKTTDVINFAQGELAMFSTFIAFWLTTGIQLPFALAFVLTLACAGALGVAVERIVIRPVTNGSALSPIIATVGLGLVLYGLTGWIWGYETRPFDAPVGGPPLRFANLVLNQINALILVTVAVLMMLLCRVNNNLRSRRFLSRPALRA